MNEHERIEIVYELLYEVVRKMGMAYAISQGMKGTPEGIEGLYLLSKQVEQAWWKYYRDIPDDEGDSINSLVADIEAENNER